MACVCDAVETGEKSCMQTSFRSGRSMNIYHLLRQRTFGPEEVELLCKA
jgi:hypothetical protein